MRFSRKVKTWLNASVRSVLPSFGRPKSPAEELSALEKQLEAIEREEKKLANMLKETRAQAEAAREAGDAATAAAKERLATKLSMQLDTQSVQAITLEENVAVLQQALRNAPPTEAASHAEATLTDAGAGAPSALSPPAATDEDISARKSRLSE